MKKVIIIGATGSLAQVVTEALKAVSNVELTLFGRNLGRLSKKLVEECHLVEGDALNYNDVEKAIEGQNIVYINLAGDLEAMSKNIVKAMQETSVRRVIATSSI